MGYACDNEHCQELALDASANKLVGSKAVTVDGVFDAETMSQWAQPYASDEWDNCIQESVEAVDDLGRKEKVKNDE